MLRRLLGLDHQKSIGLWGRCSPRAGYFSILIAFAMVEETRNEKTFVSYC